MKQVYIAKFEHIGYITLWTEENHFIRILFGKNFKLNNSTELLETPNKLMQQFLTDFKKFLNGKKIEFDFPYILKVTPFQERVLNTLKKVKFGNLITYKELSIKSGSPNAYRAVGMACKMNPLPIIIPCHRVIKSNGKIGGFAGGINLKKFLINIEKGANYGI